MSASAKPAPAKGGRRPLPFERSNGHEQQIDLDDSALYINRELSLIDSQRRVLQEAQDSRNPTLERLMFLSFVGSTIDEFFMVRVASLKRQIEKGVLDTGPDGMT